MKKIFIFVFLLAVVLSIFLQCYMLPRRFIGRDQAVHYYDMKRHFESGKLATTSARMVSTPLKNGEYNTPRVPGGTFYILYAGFFKLANENLLITKIINLIFNLLIASIFLIWIYKRFGLFILSVVGSLLLLNPYFLMTTTDFWNPSITLIFSLLFFMFFFEYCYEHSKKITQLSALLMFPMLAIMAHGHFATFFSIIPTVIVYLIIKHKKTKKYLLYFALGVFISFMLYLPYLISEINTGFNNLKLALSTRESIRTFPFPQFHALFIFPTNEMSAFMGTRIHIIKYFWLHKPLNIYGMVFVVLSLLFSLFCFIRAIVLLVRKQITKKEVHNNILMALKESMFLLLIFMPITLISFILGKSKPGTFHYLYGAYALSFTPIILFFVQNKDKILNSNKKICITLSLVILNMFAVSGEMTAYIKIFEEPRDYNVMKQIAEFFKKDANGKTIKIITRYSGEMPYAYMDIIDTYFPEYSLNTSENTQIIYTIRDNIVRENWEKERKERDNSYVIENATEVTNIGGHTIFKFNEGYKEE